MHDFNDDLEDSLARVEDEPSFIAFLEELVRNRECEDDLEKISPSSVYGPGALGWQNGTVYDFLEAAAACARAHIPNGGIAPNENPWKVCATIIYAGKNYE